jgi:hypothetical protein
MQEVLAMAKEGLPFDRWVEETGLAAKWEAQGEVRGEARGVAQGVAIGEKTAWEKAIALLKQGYTVEELENLRPGDTPP